MPISKQFASSTHKTSKTPNLDQLVHEFEQSLISHETEHETKHVLFSPLHYESGYAYPLIVWLHARGKADERQLMKVMPTVSMRNYVAIAPRGLETDSDPEQYGWPDSDHGFFEAQKRIFDCIDIARRKCHINKRRVFLVGCNEGGTMAFQLGLCFPDRFAGIISLGGRFPRGNLSQLHAIRKLPCLLSVGRESQTLPTQDIAKDMTLFHTAGMAVTVRQYPGGDGLSIAMLEDVNRWIMERVTA